MPELPRTVDELMTRPVHTLPEGANLAEVDDLMRERRVRHVPIVAEGCRLVGLITQRDVLRSAMGGGASLPASIRRPYLRTLPVEAAMHRDVVTVEPDEPLALAAERMLRHKFGCLPVVRDGGLVGILTEADFVAWFAAHAPRTHEGL